MMHRSKRSAKRVVLSLVASALLIVGSPVMATSSAASAGAHKPVSASHGDCKNDNAGKHNGFDCPSVDGSDGGEGLPAN
jgi:hypothetical protein